MPSNQGASGNVLSRMRRTSIVIAALMLLASCGDDGEPTTAGNDEPSPSSASSATPEASETPEPLDLQKYEVWFAREDGVSVTFRYVPTQTQIATAVMQELLSGTNEAEEDVDLSTLIPGGTELLGLTIDDGTAVVDLSSEFGSGGGSASMLGRVTQVVYTLTQFDTVKSVVFEIEGEPAGPLGGEGLILEGPQTRKEYASELHPIQVYEPVVGDELTSPISVSGTANVFEATVSLRLVTANGDVLAEDFTTATCGTGCVGDFETTLEFDIEGDVAAYLEVFESSAENGEPIHMVRIPLALFP